MNIGGVAIASGSGSRSQSNRDRNCWSKTLEPVAALALPLERREQFLLIEALSGCSLEVHPPHDPLTIDQELPNDERLLLVSFQVLPIALDRLESIEAQDRVVSLTRDGWDPQLTRHLSRRAFYYLHYRRRLGNAPQPVRSVRVQTRICSDAKLGGWNR
jgi:hypothetical protein